MDRKVLAAAALLAVGAAAEAGHVVGLGHYRYDPGALRPQLRLSARVDDRIFEVSGYPGDPGPGETVDFRVTVRDARDGAPDPGRVECTVHRVSVLGARRRIVQWRPGDAGGQRFRVSLADEAEYEVTFAVGEGATHASALSFPIVVGAPGSPWAILGSFGGGLALFIAGVVIAGRVRGRRALAAEPA
jgi:hypothetical protein